MLTILLLQLSIHKLKSLREDLIIIFIFLQICYHGNERPENEVKLKELYASGYRV